MLLGIPVLLTGGFFLRMGTTTLSMKVTGGTWKRLIVSFMLSILYTLDEQVAVVSIIIFGVILLNGVFEKNLFTNKVFICMESIVFYLLFYFGYGKWLFAGYTDGIIWSHPHMFTKSMEVFGLNNHIYKGSYVLLSALKHFVFNSWAFLIILACIYVLLLIGAKDIRVRLNSLYFLLSAFVLSIGITSAHEAIYTVSGLKRGMYTIPAMLLVYFSFMLLLCGPELCKQN